ISGYELIESLRDACRSQEIKIITVSALRDEEDIDRAFHAGTNDFLTKPFSNEELLPRIARQLQILKEGSASTLSKTRAPDEKRPAEPEREHTPPCSRDFGSRPHGHNREGLESGSPASQDPGRRR
ncbi:MAG: response regulator, partial [Nitrospinota bacterium]|nr:response regulator [Nitrospinota bacterium]